MSSGEHFKLLTDVPINEMSPLMHKLGHQLGSTTFELGLLGYGDKEPIKIHSESIYHPQMCPYFMLACVKNADEGGDTVVYDAVKAAQIIDDEAPELADVQMVYHAEHYTDTKATVSLLRDFGSGKFLSFRQQYPLNEVHNLPDGMSADAFYEFIDSVLARCVEFDKILKPGEIIIVNNYKTLHVRRAYKGLRKIIRVRVDDPAYDEYKANLTKHGEVDPLETLYR
jgi:alpha-ketoglutarate-dependent taurine dioxygenase